MTANSENVVKSDTLRLILITCLTEDELLILGSRDSGGDNLSDEDECEQVEYGISRGAFDLFEDKLVQILTCLCYQSYYYYFKAINMNVVKLYNNLFF